jgi:hypothetical protein
MAPDSWDVTQGVELMADDKKPKKALSDEALARIKGMAGGGGGKGNPTGGKLPKFSGKAQGGNSGLSSRRGMR